MPIDRTMELAYAPITAVTNITNVAALVVGWAAINYEVENPNDPILARLCIPQLTVTVLNATVSFSIQDLTGAPQTLVTGIVEGITAAGNTGPVFLEARFLPVNLTVTPTLQGPRVLGISALTSSGGAGIIASATSPAFLHILDLVRQ